MINLRLLKDINSHIRYEDSMTIALAGAKVEFLNIEAPTQIYVNIPAYTSFMVEPDEVYLEKPFTEIYAELERILNETYPTWDNIQVLYEEVGVMKTLVEMGVKIK